MAKRFLSTINLLRLAEDPASGSEGEIYYNTTSDTVRMYNGSSWQDVASGGGGGSSDSFKTISTPSGTNPVADSSTDTLSLTASNGLSITGNSTTDSIEFSTNATSLNNASTIVSRDADQAFDITAVDFDTVDTIASAVGRLNWDNGEGTLTLGLKGGNVNLQLGQENVTLCYNGTSSTIPNGSVVYIISAQGQRPSIALADADLESTSSKTFGIATESIANGAEGFVATFGVVNGLDTSAFTAGQSLWLSSTAGELTGTKPTPPAHAVFVGYCLHVNSSSGRIFVNPQNGYEVDELHDVLISSIADNHILSYDNTTSLWKNQGLASAIQEVDGAGSNIDADLLDGQHGSYYLDWTNTTNKPDPTITLSGDITGSGTMTDLGNVSITTTNSDKGSSQNIFKNIAVSGQSTIVADSNDDTLTISEGTGITLTTNATTDTLTVTNAGVTGITGTTNQITASASTGSVILSLPSAVTFPGTVTLNADPTQDLQAATKQYVDAVAQGLHIHASCSTATTENITDLSNPPATIDSVTLTTNMRVLVKNQSTTSQNGIYVFNGAALVRATDFDSSSEIDGGDFVFVTGGTVNNDTGWVQTETVGTVGTDSIIFTQFSGAGTYTAGTGLALNGSQFSNTGVLSVNGLTGAVSGLAVTASPTFTGTVILPTSETGGASIRIPHGVAPTAPTNGDIWTTTSGLFARINGGTQQYGPVTVVSNTPPSSPSTGQVWYDAANLGIADTPDVMHSDVITNTARWLSYGFGYTMGATFSAVTGAMRITWAAPVEGTTQFAGATNNANLIPGENYLLIAKVNNESGNTDIRLTVGYRSSGEWLTFDGTDFTMMIAFVADATSAPFGIETVGVSGKYTDVKSMNLYKVNQKGYPAYFWDGSSWQSLSSISAKLDVLSRVNTFGNQTIGGDKTFTGTTLVTSPTAAGSNGVRNITVSSSSPTGGSDGDVWLTYV